MQKRLPSLDLLRGVAAFAVAIPHLMLYVLPGNAKLEAMAVAGVEVFFVLSGYVLAPQILMCLDNPRLFPTFLMRRWMRTIPPYVFALIAMAMIAGKLGSNDFLRYLIYCQNLLGQANQEDFFAIAWSLSVEEWFYIAFPVFLLAISSLVRRSRRAVIAAVAFILIITVLREALGNYAEWGSQVRRVVLFRVDSIAYGFLLFIGMRRPPSFAPSVLASIAASILISYALAEIAGGSRVAESAFPLLAALFGASLVSTALACDSAISRVSLGSAISFWLGRVSYSVYLFHSIFAALLVTKLPYSAGTNIALVLGSTIVFCSVFYYTFEQPILESRPSYRGTSAMAKRLG